MKRRSLLGGGIAMALYPMTGHALQSILEPYTAAPAPLRVLCYHDVRDDLRNFLQSHPEATAISTDDLASQFEWLRSNGYQVLNLDEFLAIHASEKPQPARAVLLTFDDGYKSFYTHVFPLLKIYAYPALLALNQDFLTMQADGLVNYGDKRIPATEFITWNEARSMQASGLVEMASHTAYLHKGLLANPFGSMIPAAITRIYDPVKQRYEDEASYNKRLRDDLQIMSDTMQKELGKRPRAIMWPYGAYNQNLIDAAQHAGHRVGFSLDSFTDQPVRTLQQTPLMELGRELVQFNTEVRGLPALLSNSSAKEYELQLRKRIVHIDLDYIHDHDLAQQERNLGMMIERIRDLGASHVYLQAFADPDANGAAREVYFPNRHVPMRSDLFSRVAWQLKTRAEVKVYAWLPVLAFELPAHHAAAGERVRTHEKAGAAHQQQRYPRLSPYSLRARQVIREIYEDFGRSSAAISGVLFHDDATLDDYEDFSPDALKAYAQAGLPQQLEQLQASDQQDMRWTRFKTKTLTDFTLELAAILRKHRKMLKTARNIYAPLVLEPESQRWFAQSYSDMLQHYDYTAVMAMPYMEQAQNAERWLQQLAVKALQPAGANSKAVFELQSVDWRKNNQPIDSHLLASHVQLLRDAGIRHIGYYPDDFIAGVPKVEVLRPAFSLSNYTVKK